MACAGRSRRLLNVSMMWTEETYQCDHCGTENSILVDPSGGPDQQLVEDCPVCCRPHQLRILIERDGEVIVRSERAS